MMPADDTKRQVWTAAKARESVACGGDMVSGNLVNVRVRGRGDGFVVADGECAGWNLGDLTKPCRADAAAAFEHLQQ